MTDWHAKFEAAIVATLESGRDPGSERLVYADALSEDGDEGMAAAQRWMAANGKTPRHLPNGMGSLVCLGWNWYPVRGGAFRDSPNFPVTCQINYNYENINILLPAYATRQLAERALADWLAARLATIMSVDDAACERCGSGDFTDPRSYHESRSDLALVTRKPP